jgi:hypothetical protein
MAKARWFPKDNSNRSDKVSVFLIFQDSKNQMDTKLSLLNLQH